MKRLHLPLLLLVALPFIYLFTIYGDLPDHIPIHYDSSGVADGWGPKSILWILPFTVLSSAVAMTWIVPLIDVENKLASMGKKYETLRLLVVGSLSGIMTYFIANAGNEELAGKSLLLFLFGLLLIIFGNYMPAMRPNYAMGFRLPWTLKNEAVWKKTHRLAGQLWVAGGAITILMGLVLPISMGGRFFMAIVVVVSIIPIVYAYQCYQNEQQDEFI